MTSYTSRSLGLLAGSAALALIAASSIASAADLPTGYAPAPIAAVPVFTWTGFYVGLNAGGVLGQFDASSTTPVAVYFLEADVPVVNAVGQQKLEPFGFTGGAQAGFNYQMGSLVLGLETDIQFFDQDETVSSTGGYPADPVNTFTITSQVSTDWLWTLRGRVGVLATPNLLLYATGGLAVAEVKADFSFSDFFATLGNIHDGLESGSFSTTQVGWTLGAGAEYALTSGWTVKGEYLYVDLGSESVTSNNFFTRFSDVPIPEQIFTHSADFRSHIARVGVNYKF